MDLGTFITLWQSHTEDGLTYPLPELWQVKVDTIPATPADWEFALNKAVAARERQRYPVAADQVFAYALGVVWHRLGDRSELNSRATPPYPVKHEVTRAGR